MRSVALLSGGMLACPQCGCQRFTDTCDDAMASEQLGRREFACGFEITTWGERMSPCLGLWRRSEWPARARRIAWRFVPDAHMIATAVVRALLGGFALFVVEPLAPGNLASWVHLAGRIFVIMGAWTLLGHAERTFTAHVRLVGERLASRITGRKIALKPRAPEDML